VLHALATTSEGSLNIATYQQVDHHDDGKKPDAHKSEDGVGF
jgi:hypothetical protein